jgi:hypothetical protein
LDKFYKTPADNVVQFLSHYLSYINLKTINLNDFFNSEYISNMMPN